MYLLARAQSLSGRPYDALITLQRLVEELGVVTDAGVDDDFQQVRLQRDWPSVEAAVRRARAAGALTLRSPTSEPVSGASVPLTPAPATPDLAATAVPTLVPTAPDRAPAAPPTPTPAPPDLALAVPPPPAAAAPTPAAIATSPVEDVARFSAQRFAAGGLAYDAVSGRYLFGDLHGRKLMVVGDGSDHTVEMVRGDSAGFFEVTGLEIDRQRGDLWVTSTTPGGGSGALHRLQLISGRPLGTFAVDSGLEPVRLTDVAVTSAGAVLVLDSLGQRVLVLNVGGPTLEVLVTLDTSEPLSLAVTADGNTAHVAHREGLVRISLQTGTVTSVTSPTEIDLGQFERIRRHQNDLVGVQVAPDGSRRIVKVSLNASGRNATGSTVVADSIPYGEGAGPMFVTVSNDELSFLSGGSPDATVRQSPDVVPGAPVEYVVRRIPLR
jgi:hypothetical protein